MDMHTAALEAKVKQQLHNHPEARIQSVAAKETPILLSDVFPTGATDLPKTARLCPFLSKSIK